MCTCLRCALRDGNYLVRTPYVHFHWERLCYQIVSVSNAFPEAHRTSFRQAGAALQVAIRRVSIPFICPFGWGMTSPAATAVGERNFVCSTEVHAVQQCIQVNCTLYVCLLLPNSILVHTALFVVQEAYFPLQNRRNRKYRSCLRDRFPSVRKSFTKWLWEFV